MTRLKVLNPCDEPWDDMPASPAGRYCGRCEKEVVDLSRFTERDALVVASLFAPGSLCGRLRFWADGTPRHARALAVAVSTALVACHETPPATPPPAPTAVAATTGNVDRDGDGIPDRFDLCPDEAEDRDGFDDEDGCPDLDNDKDGILDQDDKCPNEPETFNGVEDEDGCPDKGGGIMIEPGVTILQNVEFDRNGAKMPIKAAPVIDEVARILRAHPDLGHLVVCGLTRKDEPRALAKKRADAVAAAIVAKGIEKDSVEVDTPEKTEPWEPEGSYVIFRLVPRTCTVSGKHVHETH